MELQLLCILIYYKETQISIKKIRKEWDYEQRENYFYAS